jgi:hypothetical protein
MLGRILAAPIRVASIGLKVLEIAGDSICGELIQPPPRNWLDQVADTVEEETEKIGKRREE